MRYLLITLCLAISVTLTIAGRPTLLEEERKSLGDRFRRNREKFEALSKDPNAKPNFKIIKKSKPKSEPIVEKLDEEPSHLNEVVPAPRKTSVESVPPSEPVNLPSVALDDKDDDDDIVKEYKPEYNSHFLSSEGLYPEDISRSSGFAPAPKSRHEEEREEEYEHLADEEDDEPLNFVALPETLARVEFNQPILEDDFAEQVKDKKVKLESCQVEDVGADVYVTCVIRVARVENTSSRKVILSYTIDDWDTKEEAKAFLMPGKHDDGWSSKYETTIKVKHQPAGHKLKFTIRYSVNGILDFFDKSDYSIKID